MIYTWETAEEINMKLAERVRGIRQRKKISQKQLAENSGVSYGSIKRFETSGQVSLLSLTKIAIALNMADEIRDLFTNVGYASIAEVVNESK
jgi:transcriptional regulator with XRE-family HTH domain